MSIRCSRVHKSFFFFTSDKETDNRIGGQKYEFEFWPCYLLSGLGHIILTHWASALFSGGEKREQYLPKKSIVMIKWDDIQYVKVLYKCWTTVQMVVVRKLQQ